ncbi:MAG: sugar ABC transporter substrate-binding protein [Gammaproteobacteria bacterium]|nr:MAG: sugar ABC transporter substrate-binding protein [Gammaproteobacteria bacterium]
MFQFKQIVKYYGSLAGVCLLGLTLGACGSQYPEATEAPSGLADNYEYVIGPGDTMEVFVWGNPDLSNTGVVRPDGMFTTRLVENIKAAGKTSSELAREVERAYSNYVKSPVVSVIVNGFSGMPEQTVRVVGEAAVPRSIPYSKGMSLLDLMIAVGGVTEFADGNGSVLVRRFGGEQKSYSLRLDDLLKDGDISANLPLMPGDVVIISESWF